MTELQGVGKMMHSDLRQTLFIIEKLKNVVNVGNCSAYQIFTSPGKQLGRIGTIVNTATQIPANEEEFRVKAADHAIENVPTSRFSKVLAALRS
jgi:hypothetical protein